MGRFCVSPNEKGTGVAGALSLLCCLTLTGLISWGLSPCTAYPCPVMVQLYAPFECSAIRNYPCRALLWCAVTSDASGNPARRFLGHHQRG